MILAAIGFLMIGVVIFIISFDSGIFMFSIFGLAFIALALWYIGSRSTITGDK